MKKFLAAMLSAVMIAGSFAGINVDAAEVPADNQQQIVEAGGSNPADGGLNSDGVSVSKVISKTDKENYFDITLTATTTNTMKEIINAQETHVVVVMDISNTMGAKQSDGKTRLQNAKEAAGTFIDLYCKETNLGKKNITFVTFNTNAKEVFTEKNVNTSDAAAMKKKINAVSMAADGSGDRFTNVQGGLRLAQNILKSVNAQNEFVVLLTDGFPTTYIKSGAGSTTEIKGYNATTSSYSASNLGKDGYFLDGELKQPAKYGTNYSDKAAIRARQTATDLKKTADIFCVGIDIGGQSIQKYIEQSEKATNSSDKFSTVDRAKGQTTFEIGTSTTAYTNWLKNKIAGGPNLSDDNATRYANGNDAAALKKAYQNILGEIKTIFYKKIEDAYVVADPMGSQVEFLGFYKKGDAYPDATVNKLTGKHEKDGETTASFKNDTISWNLLESGYTQSKSGNTTVYKYQVKYKVRLENDLAGFVDSKTYLTNGTTKLNYKVDDNGKLSDKKSIEFPMPSVKGYLADFALQKVDSEDTTIGLANAQFELSHNSNCSVCAGKVSIAKQTKTSDAAGNLGFTNLPSGHEYTLKELSAPAGYINGGNHSVVIAYDKIYLDGAEISGTAQIKNAPIAPVSTTITATKTFDGKLEAGMFKFRLEDADGNKLDEVTNAAGGSVTFKELKYTAPGTYTYKVYEVVEEGRDMSIIYDTTAYFVTVTVGVDNEKNPQSYVIKSKEIKNASTNANVNSITFANELRGEAVVELKANKTMDGGKPAADAFTFVLKNEAGEEVETVTNKADGSVTFTALSFDKPGNYKYTVVETPTDESIVYDKSVYGVEIVVAEPTDNSSDYQYIVAITKDGVEADGLTFENNTRKSTDIELVASKTMKDAELTEGAFTFILRDEAGEAIDTQSNDAEGKVTFEKITYNASGTYTYTIEEVDADDADIIYDKTVYTVTVEVTAPEDSDSFVAKATYSPGAADFVNSTRAHAFVPVEALKTMDGEPAAEAFTFVLEPDANNANELNERQEVQNDENGVVTFEDLEFGAVGTYYYNVYEVKGDDAQIIYDDIIYTVVVEVTDPGDDDKYATEVRYELPSEDEPVIADEMVFANVTREAAAVVLNAEKTLDGKAPAKDAFTFELKDEEGKVLQTKTNDEKGQIVFDELKYDEVGTYKYTITEKAGNAADIIYDKSVYTVTVEVTVDTETKDGFQAVVTMEKDGAAFEGTPVFENTTVPQVDTGDHAHTMLWTVLAALSAAVVMFIMRRKRA